MPVLSKRTSVIRYLIENNGKPDDITWSELGLQFKIGQPERYKTRAYREFVRKKIQWWWKWYLEEGRSSDRYSPKQLLGRDENINDDCEKPHEIDIGAPRLRRLYYDIETSPCIGTFWRPGWKLRITPESIIQDVGIICISYMWDDEDDVHRLEWDHGDDRQMLEDFVEILRLSNEAVGHNSDGFDLPIIRTRCLLHNIDVSPFLRSVDTLKKIKRRFRFQSNRLDDVAKQLGLGEKLKTEYHMWKYLATSVLFKNFDKEYYDILEQMGVYCDEDVRVLRRVHERIMNIVPHDSNMAVLHGGYKWHCPVCTGTNVVRTKISTTPAGTPKIEMKCRDKACCNHYVISNRSYMEMLSDVKKDRDALKYKM